MTQKTQQYFDSYDRPRALFLRLIRSIVLLAVMILILWFIIIPDYGKFSNDLRVLSHISYSMIIIAALLEVCSLLSFSALTAAILKRKNPNYLTLLRIDLTDLGVNHVIPGGGTTAAAVRFRLLKRAGVSSGRALTTATTQIIISNIALGIIFILGIILTLTTLTLNKYYITAGIFVFMFIVFATVSGWLIVRHTNEILHLLQSIAKRFSSQNKVRGEDYVRAMAQEIHLIIQDPRRMILILTFALLNWALDAAALWLMLFAFGYTLNLGGLLTAYGVASLLAMLPLTPGGIGIVEGVLTPALVGFGVPGTIALISVIGWRVLEFWLPIPASFISYITLRTGVFRRSQ